MDGLRGRSAIAFLVSVLCTSTAGTAGIVGLGALLFDLTGRELDLGLIGLAEFAPAALLVFVTGPVADRHDRRRVVAIFGLVEALIAIWIAVYVASDPTATAPIFVLVVLLGAARAFVAPAARALPSDIVSASELPSLVARFSIAWQISLIAGPVFGGILYAIDPAYPFVAMAALLVAGSGAALLIDTPARSHHDELEPPSLRDAFAGVGFIRHRPILLGAVSLDLFAVLFGGAVALLPAIAKEQLHVGSVGLGWLRAAVGIGAATTTVVIAVRPRQRNIGRTLLFVVAVFGVFTIVLGTARHFVVAFVALAILSGADAISVFIRATLVPLLTPADHRGRVLAVENVFIGASNELGAFESGVVGHAFGAPFAIVSGGIATIVTAAAWWRWFPALRDLDRFPDAVNNQEQSHPRGVPADDYIDRGE